MSTTSRFYLGVDLGRSTRIALVDSEGKIKSQWREQSHLTSGRDLVTGLVHFVKQTVEASAPFGPVAAIGVGLPGLVNLQTHVVEKLPNLSDIAHISVYDELREATGLPLVFDNDANAATFGEWRSGVARDAKNMIYITLGTGIGAGLVQGGRLQRGAKGFAGELGHLKITTDGLECGCGSSGCLETIASGPNIVRRTRELLFADPSFTLSPLVGKMRGKLSCEDIVESAKNGDKLARSILAETGLYLGMTVANIVNLLNLEMVILSGPVMRDNQYLLNVVLEEASRRAFGPSFSCCKVVAGALGDDAGVIGSAMMASDLTKDSLSI